jgi:arginase
MAEAAWLELPYPEAAVIAEDTLAEQTLALASDLPDRPLVLGGCCCAHIGAVEGLVARHDRISVVWLDAHGDLNTPATSPSGNTWGMPLRMILDAGTVAVEDVALVGARSLDAGEKTFIAETGLGVGVAAVERAVDGTDGVYVALDCDVLEPGQLETFMPEPGGVAPADVHRLLRELRPHVLGLGLTGLRPAGVNAAPLAELAAAAL